MKVEMFCEGVSVNQIISYLRKEAGNEVPVPGESGKRVKIPGSMKVLQQSEDMVLMKYWGWRFNAVNVKGGAQITTEMKYLLNLVLLFILGIFTLLPLLMCLFIIYANYFIWPAQWKKFNTAVCEGAKTMPVQN